MKRSAGPLSPYRDILAIPRTVRFTLASELANLPLPMISITLVIAVQGAYGSYALAGSLSAVAGVAGAGGAALLGRLSDQYGQHRTGYPAIAVWVCALIATYTAIEMRAAPTLLFALVVPLGACVPPFGAMARARWAYVLAEDTARVGTALAFMSIADEVIWMTGTPLATFLATAVSPLASFATAGVAAVVGAVVFLSDRTTEPPVGGAPARSATPTTSTPSRSDDAQRRPGAQAGRLWSSGMVALCFVFFVVGASPSAVGVATVAMAREAGVPAVSGLVLASFSFASLISAVLYGARTWTSPLWKRFYAFLGLHAIGLSSLVLAPNIGVVALLLFATGFAQSPTWVNGGQIIMHLAPAGRFTEALSWTNGAAGIGGAAGASLAGILIDRAGSVGGYGLVGALSVLGAVIALVGLRSIREATTRPISA